MTVRAKTVRTEPQAAVAWYSRSAEDVADALNVDPAAGLSTTRAGELLQINGQDALPEEKPKPGWLRFLEQYRRMAG
jgi:P-type Ca2+ transporter type 2C